VIEFKRRTPYVVIINYFMPESTMLTINLKDAKAGFSSLVDGVIRGEFVTITRHGKPVAALVSVEAAEIARKAIERKRSGFVAYLRTFPGGEFGRNRLPSRTVEL
jgi:prevent-host-death family protein